MATLLISHDCFANHQTPSGHPERPDRIRAVNQRLSEPKFDQLLREEAKMGDREAILYCHPESHLAMLEKSRPEEGIVNLDADTLMSPGTWEAMMRGVGASQQAIDAVFNKRADNVFCAIRPPGHHAEKEKAMGFCLVNNVAIAARYAQNAYGIERVAIVDFDVHHGNGTQDIFYDDPGVLFISTHQMPLYPGTGAKNETGAGNIYNAPLNPGDDGENFRAAFNERLLPALRDYAPELLIISAGFDAHIRDPLAHLRLEEPDYEWVTQQLMQVADSQCEGRLISMLEGGYDLMALIESTDTHVTTLMHGQVA